MKDIFPGYYRPSNEEYKKIWQNAVFIFDANILLNIYRWPKSATIDFWKVIEKVSDRIWLPHQVALEYQRNRINVILDQKNKYSEVINIFNENITNIEKRIKDLNLKKRHSEINPDETIASINSIAQNYIQNLNQSQKHFDMSFQKNDDIRTAIEDYFDKNIGKPLDSAELNNLYKKAQEDYINEKPPGFRDIKKGDIENYFVNGERIIAKYGDVILWQQILKEFKVREDITSVLFITDDVKEDWWWIEKSSGKKTIGPRPELIEDMKSIANVDNFHMYNSDRFLSYAKEFLSLDINEQSIDFVKDLKEENNIINLSKILKKNNEFTNNIKGDYKEEMSNYHNTQTIVNKIISKVKEEVIKTRPQDIYDFHLIKKNLFIDLQSDHIELIEKYGQDLFRKSLEIAISKVHAEYNLLNE